MAEGLWAYRKRWQDMNARTGIGQMMRSVEIDLLAAYFLH